MMRFLHLADVHLDTPFAGREPEVRTRLRDAVREAFRRAVDLALEESLDAFVIAGDLFDGETFTFETERFLVEQLGRLTRRGVTVVYATGNHDPGEETARRSPEWPEGVHVADGSRPVRVQVHDREGRFTGWITAIGHATPREAADLSPRFPRPDGFLPEVAVLHAQVTSSKGAEAHDRYAPTTVDALRTRGFDYWALGHVHRRQELLSEPSIHYPGNLQGRTPAESGPRGALIVELAGGRPAQVRFRALGPVRWETIDVGGLDEAESLDALIRAIAGRWRERLDDEPGVRADWMVRVRLIGGSPLWRVLRSAEERHTLESELALELDAIEVTVDAEAIHAPVDPERHIDRDDALGLALHELARLREGGGDPGRFESELQGWDPRECTVQEYLTRLLAGADADLVSRMVRSD